VPDVYEEQAVARYRLDRWSPRSRRRKPWPDGRGTCAGTSRSPIGGCRRGLVVTDDAERAGGFPRVSARSTPDKLIVSTATVRAAGREHYRQLGATLHHAQAETGLKVNHGEQRPPRKKGKTLTAHQTSALTLSESYQRNVLLIDADLRRPSLDEVFQLPKSVRP